MGSETQPAKILDQLNDMLDRIMQSDAAWCRSQIRSAMKLLKRRKPANKPIQAIIDRVAASAEKCQLRQQNIPQPEYDSVLPIVDRREDIIEAIRQHQVLVIAGETGSGKTTQIPKMCLEAGRGIRGLIGCTQPRRIAAQAMADRVAEELETELGDKVGYQVRFREKLNKDGFIKFMTDGILLAETQRDRHLLQYDCIIIDEAHERSLNIDFLLGYLKSLLVIRPDLKVVISSATLDAKAFSEFFDHAPVIEVEGRVYPVEDFFLPPGKDEELSNHILRAMHWITDVDDQGDVLIFLPGEREIRDAAAKLEGRKWKDTEILPLYGRLSMGEQQKVFKVGGRRRIILATNVAETSITIPGIHYVIDSGQVRLSRFNPRTQVQGLQIEQVSQASARQRRGRCGRVTDGICIYLYDKDTLEGSAAYTDPEIRRTSLAGVILQMDLLGLPPIEQFPLIDPPQPALMREGYQ